MKAIVMAVVLGSRACCEAQASNLKVLPWNGYRAALSLTFDDGDPGQLKIVVPELDKRGLRASFFLMAQNWADSQGWKGAASRGHEIGSHSVDHKRAADLSPDEERRQVVEARTFLEALAAKPVLAFAYPFAEITPGLRKRVMESHFIARGGWGSRYDLLPDVEPDWGDIPSLVTLTKTEESVYRGWVDKAKASGAWSVIQFHAVEGAEWGYEPVPLKIFKGFVGFLQKQKKKIWIAPMGEIGAYWKAQFILERAAPKLSDDSTRWTWESPAVFPRGIILKVTFAGKKPSRVWQGWDKILIPDQKGVYKVDFDAGELNAEWGLPKSS